jgi:predicted nucleic acid-binding protein
VTPAGRRGRPLVFDTSLLIPFFKTGAYETPLRSAIRSGRMFLASVTALELYAGTRDAAEKRALDRFVGSFAGRDLLIVPRHEDWVLGGVLLARRRRLAGGLVARDHLSDVLLVLSASQVNGTVLTADVRHLMVWASLARRAGRDVRAGSPEFLPV